MFSKFNPASPQPMPLVSIDPKTGLPYPNNNYNYNTYSDLNSRGQMKTRLKITEDGAKYLAKIEEFKQLAKEGELTEEQKDEYNVTREMARKTGVFIAMMVRTIVYLPSSRHDTCH